ncbi:electron transfer flavoprotein subunit beta/FixA family protein [Corynebacterium sp. HS2168-gen11]|uniref:electron transfer flavoprotein subunit beta/FixA family protein n=1 Tax=Corynebacterium sp. HS2168-gen11 TaxID=2974027 RepID=UPI00216B563E|nr:electron transfer flavoprotein subunit beta/FixA family protein [Corynebacterium sp. HS2168-gen11]MCS4534852.1 electron transfer flavoprotein subunit beta/FixA family protein [Corynebacterium sp. HS2168-gen11]
MPAIVVLVKNVPDTWSVKTLDEDFTLDRHTVDNVLDEINEFAVEQALRLKEQADQQMSVIALSASPAGGDQALRKALAMGADAAYALQDEALAGSDLLGTAWALSQAIRTIEDVQLVITGVASSDGATGALPGMIAEYLTLPALTSVKSVSLEGTTVRAVRETHDGDYDLRAALPALISVNDKADKPRYPNFKGIMAAKKAELQILDLATIGVAPEQVGLAHSATQVVATTTHPARSQGEMVYGDVDSQAQAIVDFLVAEKLV